MISEDLPVCGLLLEGIFIGEKKISINSLKVIADYNTMDTQK